jgi:hypothetical protein
MINDIRAVAVEENIIKFRGKYIFFEIDAFAYTAFIPLRVASWKKFQKTIPESK